MYIRWTPAVVMGDGSVCFRYDTRLIKTLNFDKKPTKTIGAAEKV